MPEIFEVLKGEIYLIIYMDYLFAQSISFFSKKYRDEMTLYF